MNLTLVEPNFLLACALIFGISLLPFYYESFLPSAAQSYSEWSLDSRVQRMESNASGIEEIFLKNLPSLLILCSSIYIFFSKNFNIFFRFIAFVLVLLYIYTQLLSGARSQVMLSLILIGSYINYKIYKFSLPQMILGSVFVYGAVTVMSAVRTSSDPVEMIIALTEILSLEGIAFLSIANSTELLTGMNTLRVIDAVQSGQESLQLGLLFIKQLLAFTPRVFWEGRPPFASEEFVQTFYPGLFEMGGGLGFSLVAEGYWDFGLLGCILYGFLVGVLGEKMYQLFLQVKHREIFIFLYAIVFLRFILLINRSGLISSVKGVLIAAIPILIVIFLYKIYTSLIIKR